MQKILTRIFWKSNITKQGGAKVAWDHLCLPRHEGVLGIKNPKEWNHAQILLHLFKVIGK